MRTVSRYVLVAIAAVGLTYPVARIRPWTGPAEAAAQGEREPQDGPQPPPPRGRTALPAGLDVTPEEETNVFIYQQVNRSVVNITTRSVHVDDFLLLSGPREGSGSGSVLDRHGHVLTNFHVVEDARRVVVTLFDSSRYEARLVGSDASNDLAVLKIDAPPDKLFPITWGDSARLLVGLRVYAIGNPFGLERTMTTGIVSSLNRSLRSENDRIIHGIIQTDAAINPGNSGGPLLNRRAEMIGITTAIVGRAAQSSGIGLAIPANTAQRVVADLVRYGRVMRPSCGINSVYELEAGLLVARLAPNGPAARAGLRGPEQSIVRRGGILFQSVDRSRADLIIAVDGRKVETFDDLLSYVESKKPGDRVVLTILRQARQMAVPIELEASRS